MASITSFFSLNYLFNLTCITCNKQIQEGIWNSTFYSNLFATLAAFIALGIIVLLLGIFSVKRYKTRRVLKPGTVLLSPVPLTNASMIIGIGLGGFIDGIVLHQVLQWHEMLSNKIAATNYVGKSINMFWDGVFHFFCLIVVIIGVVLLWKTLWRNDIDRSGRLLGGGLLVGWALFNIVEGVINHHLLNLHNVMELAPDHAKGNYMFVGISIIMLSIGYYIIRNRKQPF